MSFLFIDCCISQRDEASRTARLCRAFCDTIKRELPDIKMEHLDLTKMNLAPYTVPMLNERDRLAKAGQFTDSMFELAKQFQSAEGIVVGAPFWEVSFPAQLRIYIEHISANGLTYHYTSKGPQGDCSAKWLVYLTTAGAFEPRENVGDLHWKQLSHMFGIEQYASVFAGGLDAVPENAEQFLQAACERANQLALRLISDRTAENGKRGIGSGK